MNYYSNSLFIPILKNNLILAIRKSVRRTNAQGKFIFIGSITCVIIDLADACMCYDKL